MSGEDAGRGDAWGGDASGGGVTGDEAAWRDLVARFSLPADPTETPWPEREGLTPGPARGAAAGGGDADPGEDRGARPAGDRDGGPGEDRGAGAAEDQGAGVAEDRDAIRGDVRDAGLGDGSDPAPAGRPEAEADDSGDAGPDRSRDARPADPLRRGGADRTRVIRPATSAASPSPAPTAPLVPQPAAGPDDEGDEHFVPPPPPPLPHLDPVAKGAWTAMFGGPAYLLFTMLMGWEVPGWAALLAVMAFVGGFATVVLRLGDGPSRGSGPDNGAVL
ncbi:MAG TPA: hypothetical protein VH480_27760 [Streptosporangiaceae bacterium]